MKLFNSREDMFKNKEHVPQQGWLDVAKAEQHNIKANPLNLTGLFTTKKENPFRECQQPRPKR